MFSPSLPPPAAFQSIPKVDLHRHLELSLRSSTIRELAPQHGISLPTEKDFQDRFLITEPMKNLGAVLNKFLDTQKLLSTPEILERITYECCHDAFHIEGIRLLELRYSPSFVRQNHESMSYTAIHQSIVKGMKRATKEFPIAVGLICIIQRILPPREAKSITDFAIDHKDTFVGLDLADNEEGFDSKPFAHFFHRAAKAGLGITVHSGEAPLRNAPRYVKEAIEYLGAQRIGHGVQIYRDEKIVEFVARMKIPLELCPTSNWLTQAIPDLKEYPFRRLMEAGVQTTINTDDPGIFNTDLIKEYQLMSVHQSFSLTEFEKCNDISARASFIPIEQKRKVWPRAIESK